jgi:membrane fusion protein (multidrug efflux system)
MRTRPRRKRKSHGANLLSSKFALNDTEIWSPIDGIVANRKTRVGEYVTAGTRMLSVVPTTNLWIEANYRETQVGQLKVGDPVRVHLDTYPGKPLCGYVEAIAPASGSEFALIPPDNATGNFTKIVRRFTVRIRLNAREPNAARPSRHVRRDRCRRIGPRQFLPNRKCRPNRLLL